MGKSILAVEDYPETLELMKSIFQQEGYEVRTATTGEEALEEIAKHQFNLVLLDIMLPRIDGFDVCRRIKSSPKTKNLPVIAVTAFDVPDIVNKCKLAGVDEVILKPFDPVNLVEMIKRYST